MNGITNKPNKPRFTGPDVDGPDYVALVIEWQGPVDDIEDQITTRNVAPSRWQRVVGKVRPIASKVTGAPLAIKALGAVGVAALAGWGIHRLRTA